MNLTNTSNKELAEGISVDRSLISLLRNGKRKTPRNHDHIRHMASYFAKNCSADFQFHALTEMLEKPTPIYFISDVNLEWLFEDYQFMSEFSDSLSAIFQKGFTLYHIMPSLNFMNRYVESLRYWLPIYASGHAKVYYYPRLRDNLYRRSLILIPGLCVQATTSIGDETDLITVNSTDRVLVNAYDTQFHQQLALCRPALTSHHHPQEFSSCLRELLVNNTQVIHKSSKPTPYTLPRKFLDLFIDQLSDPDWKANLQTHRDDAVLFEEKLKHSEFFELCPLASPEDIRAGKVLFGLDIKTEENHPVYTPEIYAMHLEHILELTDKYENYHFIPIKSTERQDYNLFTSESGLTLLLNSSQPQFMLEIRRPELSHACHEYLMRMADLVGYAGIRRAKIRMQLKELIQELRN